MTRSAPRTVLVTAGPTREHLDPVRYLTNESSGKMGFEIAAGAARAGDRALLIAGPVEIGTPPGVERIDVVSAREMLAACRAAFREADVLVAAAAVCDWRPRRKRSGKWREKDSGKEFASIALVRNPDILATLARRKGGRLVIGFALETGNGLRRARAKLRRKRTDYMVLNDASALGADRSRVIILGRDGSEEVVEGSKRQVARAILRLHPLPASRQN